MEFRSSTYQTYIIARGETWLPDAAALAGAELAVSGGWIGLRSHPRVVGSIVYGGPDVPSWLDVALRDIVPAAGASPDMEA